MTEIRNYTIGRNRFKEGAMTGFSLQEEGLVLTEGVYHGLFLPAINSYEAGSLWGILSLQGILPKSCTLVMRVFAMDIGKHQEQEVKKTNAFLTNPQIEAERKREFFLRADSIKSVNGRHLLLYSQKGQYLWICLELMGAGEGYISHLYLENPGDNFMQTFPEIYQERNSFFHRYMSVFSTIYKELQEKIDHGEDWMSMERAEESLLYLYADWLGLTLKKGILPVEVLRLLLQEAYRLNSIKGTRKALMRVIELVTGEKAVIVERNLIAPGAAKEAESMYNRLYGVGRQDVTILMNRKPAERLQAQLLYLLNQFKPIRSRIKLVFYQECRCLDSYCFLDRNALLGRMAVGEMDAACVTDKNIILA